MGGGTGQARSFPGGGRGGAPPGGPFEGLLLEWETIAEEAASGQARPGKMIERETIAEEAALGQGKAPGCRHAREASAYTHGP